MKKHLLGCLLCVLPFAAPAQQVVSISDLLGSEMTALVTNDRVIRRAGQQFESQYHMDWKVRFVTENTIVFTLVGTTAQGKTPVEEGREVQLSKAAPTSNRGGGHRVFFFEAGVLHYLRTYEGGAMKGVFSFSKSDTGGFNCAVHIAWPREVGVATIKMRSARNAKIELLREKQSASSCSVSPMK